MTPRPCACGCGRDLPITARTHARYYSGACRVAAHRASGPAELRRLPRWVRYNSRKVPLTTSGEVASSTDPETWTTHRAAVASKAGVGLGFVLNGDGIVCLDLDHCLVGDQLVLWAAEVIERIPATYIEVSPSGAGLHVWGRGSLPHGRKTRVDGGAVECYGTGRYITITGRRYGQGAGLADLTEVLNTLIT